MKMILLKARVSRNTILPPGVRSRPWKGVSRNFITTLSFVDREWRNDLLVFPAQGFEKVKRA
jgi:hypothetical protein